MSRLRPRSALYAPPDGGADLSSVVAPHGLAGLVAWFLPGRMNDIQSAKIAAAEDLSGAGHDVAQATAGSRPALAVDANGQPSADFGPAAGDRSLIYGADWAQTDKGTVVCVARHKENAADAQILLFSETGALSLFLSGRTGTLGTDNTPLIDVGGVQLEADEALEDGELYLLRFAWDFDGASDLYLSVNDGEDVTAESSDTTLGDWHAIGLPVGVAANRDLIGSILGLMVYDRLFEPAEWADLKAALNARHGVWP